MIAAVDINGFVVSACTVVPRKHSATDRNGLRGTVDQERFLQSIKANIIPLLGNFAMGEPRSVVVLDNAFVHKDGEFVRLSELHGGIVIWNAAYSPDLNPIEKCFNQYKSFLRRYGRTRHYTGVKNFWHYEALECATRDNMCRYYRGAAFEGCIRNVPLPPSAAGRKRKFVTLLVSGVLPGVCI